MSSVSIDVPAVQQGKAARKRDWAPVVLNVYLLIFFAYMFLPLLIMVVAAFNANPTPSVTEWQGTTLQWFPEILADQRMMQGLWHSLLIAAGVIAVSIPLGLAGALLLTRLESRANTLLYTILVSPVLTPGIILGVTTMIFWRDTFSMEAGLLTATIAQSTFIASYCMLLFMARLQRQDRTQEEAALDLGASSFFLFRRVTLPFLYPTIATAAVIAFLQSIENYNTTFFAIGGSWTLVTEIGARMRFGLSPMINAIGVVFIVLTVVFAVVYVLAKQRK
jgi:spermidine/putrescine transport system permease protein